eukprot:1776752-Amphidinium_carterae.1
MLAQSELIQRTITSIQQQGTTITERSATVNSGKGNGTGKPWNLGWINNYQKGAGKTGKSRPQVFNIADNIEHWHQEPDHIQFQACGSAQQPLGKPSQPLQSQMGALYNEALCPIGAHRCAMGPLLWLMIVGLFTWSVMAPTPFSAKRGTDVVSHALSFCTCGALLGKGGVWWNGPVVCPISFEVAVGCGGVRMTEENGIRTTWNSASCRESARSI